MSDDDELALAERVVAAAEEGAPGDRARQIRLIAQHHGGFGIGLTLRALDIVLARYEAEQAASS